MITSMAGRDSAGAVKARHSSLHDHSVFSETIFSKPVETTIFDRPVFFFSGVFDGLSSPAFAQTDEGLIIGCYQFSVFALRFPSGKRSPK